MSKTITSGSVTFVDLSDNRKLEAYITSNLPTSQIYNTNTSVYTPDWSVTHLQLSANIYLDSKDVTTDSQTTIVWYKRIGTGTKTQVCTGASLTVTTNEMSDSLGIITYICESKHQDIVAYSQMTFTKIDTGLNGSNGVDGSSVNILGSYSTLKELQSAHPTGQAGDAYIINGSLYVWATKDSRWENVGNIQGPKGDPGENAKSIILNGDSQIFKIDKTGKVSPDTIVVTAQTLNTSITNWTYSTNGGVSFVSTPPSGVTRNGNTITVAGSTTTADSIIVKASDGVYSDTYTIYKVSDGIQGDSAAIAFLTNENISFSANANGQIGLTTFTTNVVGYKGTTKVTPTIGVITGLPTGMTVGAPTTTSNELILTFTIANNSTLGSNLSNMGVISIPITSPVNTVLSLTWIKVNTGVAGAPGSAGSDGYTVLLTNESHVFAGDVSNALVATTTTQAIAYKGSTAQTVTIVSVNGVTAATNSTATGITGLSFACSALSGTNPTITFTSTTDFKTANGAIPIVLTVGGLTFTKYFSYSISFKGNTGASGSAGAIGNPATAYWLISSASAVQKTSTGTIMCTPSSLTFTAKSQTGVAAPVDYAGRWVISYSTNGSTYAELYKSTTNEVSKTITIDPTYKTIKCQMYLAGGTTSLLDEQIIPIVSDGTSVTVSSIQYQVGTSATTTPTGTWSNTVVSVPAGSYLWTKTTFSDGKTAYGVAKQGANGTSAVTFQLYAPNGYVMSSSLESLTLKGFAYDGATEITSATYVWSYQSGDTWVAIAGATTDSLTLTKEDVEKAKTYRCEMTYKDKTYCATATVQDKTDIYDVMICVSDNINPLTGIYYWVVYALLYSEQGEADPLLGPISTTAPTSPTAGDYWYTIDPTTATVTLKKYNGTTWTTSTDKQEYMYDWRQIVNGTEQQSIGNTDKVKVIPCSSFTSEATFQCIVTESGGDKLARCSIHLTDTSDPIVSATAPVGVKNGQIWMQTQTDGTFLLHMWNESEGAWKQLNADTKNVVHTTKPSSYRAGDLWVVEDDNVIAGYSKGSLLQSSATTTTFAKEHWSPSLKYEEDIDSIRSSLNSYLQYMSVDDEGLHMQAKDASGTLSPFEALFTNTKLAFCQSKVEVAYISDNRLNIPQANIDTLEVNKVHLQKFEWAIEDNGSMSLIVNY